MSSRPQPIRQIDLWECDECGDDVPSYMFFNEAMCSEQCERQNRARTLLNKIKYNHEFCLTCFSRLKEVERPGELFLSGLDPETRDAVIGLQYRTKYADVGEKTREFVDALDAVATGTICRCGATTHYDADPTIRDLESIEIVPSFMIALEVLRSEDETDERVNPDRLLDELDDGADHREAIAKALIL